MSRTTIKQVDTYITLIGKYMKKENVSYHTCGNRYQLLIGNEAIGHLLLIGEFYSMLVGMAKLLEITNRSN